MTFSPTNKLTTRTMPWFLASSRAKSWTSRECQLARAWPQQASAVLNPRRKALTGSRRIMRDTSSRELCILEKKLQIMNQSSTWVSVIYSTEASTTDSYHLMKKQNGPTLSMQDLLAAHLVVAARCGTAQSIASSQYQSGVTRWLPNNPSMVKLVTELFPL